MEVGRAVVGGAVGKVAEQPVAEERVWLGLVVEVPESGLENVEMQIGDDCPHGHPVSAA